MPLTLERIEKEVAPRMKKRFILDYYSIHRNLHDIRLKMAQPMANMTDPEKESYAEMLTELILKDLPKKEILRQIPTLVQKVKAKE